MSVNQARPLQFSLRSLLTVITFVGIGCALYSHPLYRDPPFNNITACILLCSIALLYLVVFGHLFYISIRTYFASKQRSTYFLHAMILTICLFLGVLITRVRFLGGFDDWGLTLTGLSYLSLHPGFVVFLAVLIFLTRIKELYLADTRTGRISNLAVSLSTAILGILYSMATLYRYWPSSLYTLYHASLLP